MTQTPQTNITLQEIADELQCANSVVIAGHVSPDGDCIGSQLALTQALQALGKTVHPTLATKRTPPVNLRGLAGFDQLVFAGDVKGDIDAFVALDVPNTQRLEASQTKLLHSATISFTIDHHATDQRMTQYAYIDPKSAACALLVWQLIKCLGVKPTAQMAQCAYIGVMTDTTSFRNQNTTSDCFQAAREMMECGANPATLATDVFLNRSLQSLQLESLAISRMKFTANSSFVVSYILRSDMTKYNAKPEDSDVIIDTLRSIRGVRVACFLKEILIDGKLVMKGSLRAKDDTDVSVIARKYNGGGHKGASGFRMYCSFDVAMQTICKEFEDCLKDSEC